MGRCFARLAPAAAGLLLVSMASAQSVAGYNPVLPPVSASQNYALVAGAPSPGLTLFQPMFDGTARLLANDGTVVKSWPPAANPGLMTYLLPNGNLLRTEVIGAGPGGGSGGRVLEVDEDGNTIWQFDYSSPDFLHHHDVEPLPNGNVLMIAWEFLAVAEAVGEGRDPALTTGARFSPDSVLEIQPDGMGGATIVWQWRVMDHVVQDFDMNLPNFGVVADHPELVNLNFPANATDDWNHVNAVDYNANLDQVAISANFLSEIWIIDHSTTTAEAAGHTGGSSGKGGDVLYRWGNPQSYGAGLPTDQTLFRQHDIQWIEDGRPGAGNFTVFNNGVGRPAGAFSSVDEWVSPVDAMGNYALTPGSAYGPAAAIWSYTDPVPTTFFSSIISGAERLPNGNTLIINGVAGHMFEVTPGMQVIWEFLNPFGSPSWIFKARRYDYACGTVPYCVAGANSAGPGALIDSSGSTSLAANDFVLEVEGTPPGVSGLFFYGETSIQAPFGDGFRCAGGMTHRMYPILSADGAGNVTRALDVTAPPANAGNGLISTGSTWNFQLWYRDMAGPGGTGFNTSDALAVTFCQ
ncbi:MAG: hypothetical protein ACI8QZ_002728 [Chlamydiales bacterium]|jgi:hypothetical protein